MKKRRTLGQSGYRLARQFVIGIFGVTVCLIGVAMLVLPGPGTVVIPAGLAILSLEFAFARRWLKHLRERISKTMQDRTNKRVSKYR